MKKVDWDLFADTLADKLRMPRRVLDYIAVKDILILCASGICDSEIAKFLDTDEPYVREAIGSYLKTSGWQFNLDLNPYMIFKTLVLHGYSSLEDFCKELQVLSPTTTLSESIKMYNIVVSVTNIENEMEIFWE